MKNKPRRSVLVDRLERGAPGLDAEGGALKISPGLAVYICERRSGFCQILILKDSKTDLGFIAHHGTVARTAPRAQFG